MVLGLAQRYEIISSANVLALSHRVPIPILSQAVDRYHTCDAMVVAAGGKSIWFAAIAALVLILYGVIPILQPANFGRVYAYGGIFILLAIYEVAGR